MLEDDEWKWCRKVFERCHRKGHERAAWVNRYVLMPNNFDMYVDISGCCPAVSRVGPGRS
jgi:hypothetical protein